MNPATVCAYARVSTDGPRVDAQVRALRTAGAGKVFREVASGAKTDRPQLRRLLDQLDAGRTSKVAGRRRARHSRSGSDQPS